MNSIPKLGYFAHPLPHSYALLKSSRLFIPPCQGNFKSPLPFLLSSISKDAFSDLD